MMSEIFTILLAYSTKLGYLGIVLLMAVESSIVPLPSEIVIPPAGYLASLGQMNLFLIILSGTLGSVIGASFNYFVSLKLGRAIVHGLARKKIARLFLINEQKVIKAEEYFVEHGKISTLIGRLVPAVRHLISIPAGISRMNYKDFVIYTAIGSFIWSTILAMLGYWFGSNQKLLLEHYHEIGYGFILVAMLFVGWWYYNWKKGK